MVAISRAGSSIFVKTESLSMLGLQKKNRVRRSKNIKGTSSETHWHHLLFFSIFGIFLVFASLVVCWSPTKPVSKCGFPFQSPKKQKKNNLQFSFQHLKGGVFINSHGGRSPESASALTTPTLSTFGSRESPGSLDRPTEPKECSRLRDSRGSGPPSQLDFLDIYGENMVSTPKSLPTHQFWWDMTRKVWDLILW